MAKVLVIPSHPTSAIAGQLAQRVTACGCELVLSDHAMPASQGELAAAVEACDVVLVAIAGRLLPETIIETLEVATRTGKRLCGIWLPDTQQDALPQILEDMADAILSWNSQKFCAAVCEGEVTWEDLGGSERPIPQNVHHRCK